MSGAVADGLSAAQSFGPGHGQLTAALAAKPDWLGGQLGYQHHVSDAVAVFAEVAAGARKVGAGPWTPDVGALAGIKVTF